MKQRLVLAAGLLLSLSMTANGQEVFTDSITVRGEAITKVSPDTIVWTVALERHAGSAERARAALDAETTRVRESVAAAGLQDSDVTIARLQVRESNGQYVARRSISLSQKKIGNAISLMNQLKALRPAELSYRLEHSRRKDLEHETQQQAVSNARSQATIMARELDAGLGRVIVVDNEFGNVGEFGLRPRFSAYKATPLEHVSSESFTDAKIRVHASVYVTYSIGAALASAG